MTITELIVLLPCHSLEDFPLYHEGAPAAELLSSWTALWHPALVAACGKMPRWYRADFPPDHAEGRVFLVPSLCERLIAAGWKERVQGEGAVVVAATSDCLATAAELCRRTSQSAAVDQNLELDFLAFGYCYLQIELLTRQMRYSSSLDEPHVENQLVLAAKAALAGDAEIARGHLRKCFDVLMEARDRFYPVDSYLLDIILTADPFLDEPLRAELASPTSYNIYLTGATLAALPSRYPETFQALQAGLASGAACVVGGDYDDLDLPLLPLDALERDFVRAQDNSRQRLDRPIRVYLRRRFGLSPLLPMLLSRQGFVGCMHCTFDDGTFPPIGQSKTRWQSLDGSAVDAFGRIPLDARRPETFLAFSQKLAESMDLDHVAAVALVHWPQDASFWFSLLKRIHSFADVLGKFVTLEHFFEQTDSTGRLDKYDPDDYRSPYLKQAVARGEVDPISRHVRQALAHVSDRAQRLLRSIVILAAGDAETTTSDRPLIDLAGLMGATPAPTGGIFVFNPFAHTVTPSTDGAAAATFDVPGLGFAWHGANEAPCPEPIRRKSARSIALENSLANEHLEVLIDPETGGIRSIRDFAHRGNRLSQQLALRMPGTQIEVGRPWRDPDETAHYSVMVAERIEPVTISSGVGELHVTGRMVDRQGALQGRFNQRLRLARGSRMLNVDIHLEPLVELPADPWAAYYACRFAWSDETADLVRSLHGTCQPTKIKRLEAPRFIEIHEGQKRTAILTGGLPYHRRVGQRMLDSLLIVHGETCRDFRIAIGLDLPDLAGRAEELLLPEFPTMPVNLPSVAREGWFFHLDRSNIVVLDWAPLTEENTTVGFRAKLLETAGRPGRVKLRTFRPVAQAQQVDARHHPIVTLSATGETILIDFSVFELVEIEARWAAS